MRPLPRIESVTAYPDDLALEIRWKNGDAGPCRIVLAGWIATGRDILAPLADDPGLFADARVTAYGSAVAWGEDGGDLAIDAEHLRGLAEAQAPMLGRDLAVWQERFRLSNTEAAGLLDVGRSTFLGYKAAADKALPRRFAIAVRASMNDPIVIQAHFRPAPEPGRPRKSA